jgi:hypothetical protein
LNIGSIETECSRCWHPPGSEPLSPTKSSNEGVAMKEIVQIGIIGSQFVSAIHADSLRQCADAEIVAVASATKGHVKAFADKFGTPQSSWRKHFA